MRFEFDNNGYVSGIFCGCYSGHCIEYTGLVPNEPETYEDMYDEKLSFIDKELEARLKYCGIIYKNCGRCYKNKKRA